MTITEEEYLKAVEIVEAYKRQKVEKDFGRILSLLPEKIDDLQLSTRAKNILRQFAAIQNGKDEYNRSYVYYSENKVSDVIPVLSLELMGKLRNCGETTATEIQNIFLKYGFQIPIS